MKHFFSIFFIIITFASLSQNIIAQTPVTSEQDSNVSYVSLSFLYWLKKGLDMSEEKWQRYLDSTSRTPSQSLAAAFARMPDNIFEPMPQDIVQNEISRSNALSVRGVSYFDGSASGAGINFDIHKIAMFIGIEEDVTPKITYTLSITADVSVKIYSISAIEIAELFSGTQKPGKYSFYWNGKTSEGKKVQAGNYIAEVRIGKDRYVRKRIVID